MGVSWGMGNRGREGPWSPAPALSLVTAVFLAGSWAALPSHRVLPEHHVSAETGAIFVQALEQERFQEAFVAGREDDGGERARGVLRGPGGAGGTLAGACPPGQRAGTSHASLLGPVGWEGRPRSARGTAR